MGTFTAWIPKEVVKKMNANKNHLVIIDYNQEDFITFDKKLNKDQIEKLYNWDLKWCYVNGEFVCYI